MSDVHGESADSIGAGAPAEEIEITSAMIAAGEDVILARVGGAEDLGGFFSAAELAKQVFRAMVGAAALGRIARRTHNRKGRGRSLHTKRTR